jgi:hypothetical protein
MLYTFSRLIMVDFETCNLLVVGLLSSCRDTEYVTSRQKGMGQSNSCSPNLTRRVAMKEKKDRRERDVQPQLGNDQ